MTAREEDLFNTIFHLMKVIRKESIENNMNWSHYHLFRATQGLVADQKFVNYIHDQFKKTEEYINE